MIRARFNSASTQSNNPFITFNYIFLLLGQPHSNMTLSLASQTRSCYTAVSESPAVPSMVLIVSLICFHPEHFTVMYPRSSPPAWVRLCFHNRRFQDLRSGLRIYLKIISRGPRSNIQTALNTWTRLKKTWDHLVFFLAVPDVTTSQVLNTSNGFLSLYQIFSLPRIYCTLRSTP